ncbi:MAG: type II toxin-antitoxin system VapC family toxin [Candidatus Nanopelagicales bacterium]|jgi:predicted nucleic acid-binding protein
MKTFVLDASLALEWFAVGASTEVLAKRSLLDDHVAVVPTSWRFEVMNAVTTWRRRGDISHADCAVLLHDIMQIPFGTVDEGDPELVVSLASAHGLSAYDATYLRVAMITGDPLATLDAALKRVANEVGVTCL